MRKRVLVSLVAGIALWGLLPTTAKGDRNSNLESLGVFQETKEVQAENTRNLESLKALQEKKGTQLNEVAAIANIVLKNPNMVHFDEKSNEYCLFAPVGEGFKYMVHFSAEPGKTSEGMMFFLDVQDFSKAGLTPTALPPLPKKLGRMEAYQWYYYDGTYIEPHHHLKLPPYVVMAFPVKD
jgi:hypothetical protein